MSQSLAIAVLTLFAGSIAVAALAPSDRRLAAPLAALTMAASLAFIAPHMPAAASGGLVVQTLPWMPDWGLNLSFRLDGLGLLFVALILGIGLLIVLYAVFYLPKEDGLARFFSYLLAFAGGMLGVVLAENVVLLVILWEVTSLTSFLLIAYKHQYHEGRIGARMALAITGGGGLALLAGLLLLGRAAGSFELSVILASGDAIRAHPHYPVILVLVLLGAFTKSAQFPFHFWLPNAMAAPTPVSTYLHSATMVKAGIFLLGRLHPALAGTDMWFWIVSTAGAITFAYAAFIAMTKHDLKGLLAYSTVSHLGLITLLFGLDTPMASVTAVFHIINHALFKAALFMAAGIIDHESGTRDMRRLHGLYGLMPVTATLAILAAASMAGAPLLNGFLSKEMFFMEAVEHPRFQGGIGLLFPVFATLAGALSVAYSFRFIHDVFFNGQPLDLPKTPHEPVWPMRAPVELLVVLVVIVGLLPQLSVGWLVKASAGAVLGPALPEVKIKLWHGVNLPLLMSIAAFALGYVYYRNREAVFALNQRFRETTESPALFDRAYLAFERLSRRAHGLMDRDSLQSYLGLFVVAALVMATSAYLSQPAAPLAGTATGLPLGVPETLGLVALALALAASIIWHQQRLKAIIALSVVGTLVVLIFVRFSAPDLALTQLSVEVVTILLLLLAMRFLPGETSDVEPRGRVLRDGAIACAAGLGAGLLAYAMMTRPLDTISGYFLANSKPGGGGTNVVNVILVDFRGFDTLGEICVLALAALAADAALRGLKLHPYAAAAAAGPGREATIFAMLMRPLLPLALVVSIYIFLRGHNLPGGGFIAGLVTAVALLLQYMAGGAAFVAARMTFRPRLLFAFGIFFAAGVGLASMALGWPFLTSTFGYVYPPLIGKTELASAMVFDLGVYLIVVAGTLLIITALGALSGREAAVGDDDGAPRPASSSTMAEAR